MTSKHTVKSDEWVRTLLKDPTEDNIVSLMDEVIKPFLIDILDEMNELDKLEDFVQDAYCVLRKKILPNIDKDGPVKSYIYTVVKNMSISALERVSRRPHVPSDELPPLSPSQDDRSKEVKEHIKTFVLHRSPREYAEMVEFIIDDLEELAVSKMAKANKIIEEFSVEKQVARATIDLTIMLARAACLEFAEPHLDREILPGYQNPYLVVLEIRYGDSLAWDIAQILKGMTVKF